MLGHAPAPRCRAARHGVLGRVARCPQTILLPQLRGDAAGLHRRGAYGCRPVAGGTCVGSRDAASRPAPRQHRRDHRPDSCPRRRSAERRPSSASDPAQVAHTRRSSFYRNEGPGWHSRARRCRSRSHEQLSSRPLIADDTVAPDVREGTGRRWRRGQPRSDPSHRLGATARTRQSHSAVGHRVRSADRRDDRQHHRQGTDRPDDQRLAARTAASMAGRRHGEVAGVQCPRRSHVHSLARHPAAGQHGRRSGAELLRHSSRPGVRLPFHRSAERDLLVPQPLGVSGAAGRLRASRDRAARARALPVRPRACRDAHGLDRRGRGARVQEAEEEAGLLQPSTANPGDVVPGRQAATA